MTISLKDWSNQRVPLGLFVSKTLRIAARQGGCYSSVPVERLQPLDGVKIVSSPFNGRWLFHVGYLNRQLPNLWFFVTTGDITEKKG